MWIFPILISIISIPYGEGLLRGDTGPNVQKYGAIYSGTFNGERESRTITAYCNVHMRPGIMTAYKKNDYRWIGDNDGVYLIMKRIGLDELHSGFVRCTRYRSVLLCPYLGGSNPCTTPNNGFLPQYLAIEKGTNRLTNIELHGYDKETQEYSIGKCNIGYIGFLGFEYMMKPEGFIVTDSDLGAPVMAMDNDRKVFVGVVVAVIEGFLAVESPYINPQIPIFGVLMVLNVALLCILVILSILIRQLKL